MLGLILPNCNFLQVTYLIRIPLYLETKVGIPKSNSSHLFETPDSDEMHLEVPMSYTDQKGSLVINLN